MNTCLLYSRNTQKFTMRDKIIASLRKETELPGFSNTARKLMNMVQQPNVHLDALTQIVSLDPGITAKFLKVASSPAYGGFQITSIHQALGVIGLNEVKRVALSLMVISQLKHLRVRVNWDLFWVHSLLTARLTELLADSYRPVDGKEYMAGLLHDVGKLFIEHYFPQEFELVVMRASMVTQNMYQAEQQLLDMTHAEVSSLLSEQWKLHPEIIRGIRFHHEPNSPLNVDTGDPQYQNFLALCIFLADRFANLCHAKFHENLKVENISLEDLPEWKQLNRFTPRLTLNLDVNQELKKAQELIASLKSV